MPPPLRPARPGFPVGLSLAGSLCGERRWGVLSSAWHPVLAGVCERRAAFAAVADALAPRAGVLCSRELPQRALTGSWHSARAQYQRGSPIVSGRIRAGKDHGLFCDAAGGDVHHTWSFNVNAVAALAAAKAAPYAQADCFTLRHASSQKTVVFGYRVVLHILLFGDTLRNPDHKLPADLCVLRCLRLRLNCRFVFPAAPLGFQDWSASPENGAPKGKTRPGAHPNC